MRDPLSLRAGTTPDATALVEAETAAEWSYADLAAAAAGTAGRLADRVGPGDRIGTLLDTGIPFVRVVHAALRLGCVLVPLNLRLPRRELRTQAAHVGLDAIVHGPESAATAREVTDAPAIPAGGDPDPGAAPAPADRPLSEPAVVLFTSGTTGDPKAVPLTRGNLLASACASAVRLGVLPGDRWQLALPMYHMGGLAPVLRSALYGTAVVLQRGFDADAVPEVADRYGVTGISLVPTMLRRILDAGGDLSGLRFVLLGGAGAPEGLIERCREESIPVYPTYGMTETASQVATATPAEAFSRPGTVGRPLFGTSVTVVDEDGNEVPEGKVGEIAVSGPTVTPGYLDDPGRTAAAFGEHGLETGDAGYVEDGRLWVVGRRDDRIVTGGENVHPAGVRRALREHPAVEDAAVVGVDDPEWGERVAALVVAAGDVDEGALREHCRDRLAGFEIPRTIRFADELPRTASGTVDRDAVRARIGEP